MAGIHDATENSILNLIFRAVAWSGYADNTLTSAQTQIGIALHTADPGDAGNAASNEMTTAAYGSYARVNVPRTTGGWTASVAGSISPSNNIDFPTGTGGTGASATNFSTSASNGSPPTGAAVILWSGAISPAIVCGVTVAPRLTTATTITLT